MTKHRCNPVLRLKKGPDFDFDGEYLVMLGKVAVAVVYYDRQTTSWRLANVDTHRSQTADFLGFNKEEMFAKLVRLISDR